MISFILGLLAGVASPTQASVNSRIREDLRSPYTTSVFNFICAAVVMAAAMLVIEKFNVKQGFLRKAAESVNNTGVHDVSLTKEGVSVSQAAPAAPKPAEPQAAATPFKMPSFASAKPPMGSPASGGASPFQKPVSSPFGRPRATPQPPRMPVFGRPVDRGNAEVSDDEIELRPYVPKK